VSKRNGRKRHESRQPRAPQPSSSPDKKLPRSQKVLAWSAGVAATVSAAILVTVITGGTQAIWNSLNHSKKSKAPIAISPATPRAVTPEQGQHASGGRHSTGEHCFQGVRNRINKLKGHTIFREALPRGICPTLASCVNSAKSLRPLRGSSI
jgi:hypothetical protein